jgi:type I restriction enzyme S subunit
MIDNSKWQPYPDYRDSGVDWVGEIPIHWEILPLRRGIPS